VIKLAVSEKNSLPSLPCCLAQAGSVLGTPGSKHIHLGVHRGLKKHGSREITVPLGAAQKPGELSCVGIFKAIWGDLVLRQKP